MKTQLLTFALAVLFLLCAPFVQAESEKTQSKIQIALLLDTSSSMDGLINQAKTELWSIVNELATARYHGERPLLEIAIYEYGNSWLSATDGYIRLVSPLTTDLDEISELLFSLKTYGGFEYCGQVIDQAADELKWSESHSDLKMIVIAGNEEFTQGTVDYVKACKKTIGKGIIINTIFCGNHQEGVRTKWKHGADLADGKYMNIDQDLTIAYIESPFDAEILELNTKLNKTYIGYGTAGMHYSMRQEAQDINAQTMSKGASVQRTVSKSSEAYNNSHWDLVDAAEDSEAILDEISANDLPEEMKKMTKDEQKEYINTKRKERQEIQEQIRKLNKKRDAYVAKQRTGATDNADLGSALKKIVREQALEKAYDFEKH